MLIQNIYMNIVFTVCARLVKAMNKIFIVKYWLCRLVARDRAQDQGQWSQDSWARDSWARTDEPGQRSQHRQARTEVPGHRSQDTGARTEEPGQRRQDRGGRTEEPGQRSAGQRRQDRGARTEKPGQRSQDIGWKQALDDQELLLGKLWIPVF